MTRQDVVLVTGATGYVGGRLVPRLLEAGYHVRVLVRDSTRLQGRPWLTQVEVVQGDALIPETLSAAMHGVNTLYYLIHSMRGSTNFNQLDLTASRYVGGAACDAGVQRIIYLGGLGGPESALSPHLRSRQATGEALRECGIPVTEFRAAVIVGSGSVSFEIIRYLTERLPVMVCPRWVYTRVQPISIRNVLDYLVAALATPESIGKVIEIGGADVLTYREMMIQYAKARGLRRYLISVPALSPRLASYWVHLVTPVPADIARPLIEGLRNEVIVRDNTAHLLFPEIEPRDYQTALERALARLHTGEVETTWSDALVTSQGSITPVVFTTQEGMSMERRLRSVNAPPEAIFRVFAGLGGKRGWLYYDILWRLRGLLDRLVGGVGFRRGRRHPDEVRVGDAVDFWRVEAVQPGQLLRLRAEMKVPGRAWLQFEALPMAEGKSLLVQTAFFDAKGLFGILYWYLLYPIHRLMFSGMIRQIARRAEANL